MANESSGGSDVHRAVVQTARELRFLSFASLEYDGSIYMTPQDFLESVTDEAPRGELSLNCKVGQYVYLCMFVYVCFIRRVTRKLISEY